MLEVELIELANKICKHKAEKQTIEVKSAHEGCPKLRDTLSSFSNQDSGGIIVFGLDEKAKYKPVGVYNVQELQKHITEQCVEMEPPVRALFTFADYEGVIIGSAEIPPIELSERPCYHKAAGKANGSFIRVGEADLHMTDYEIYSYEAFRKHVRDDERQVERASIESLNQTLVDRYIQQRIKDRPGLQNLQETQLYEMLGITKDGLPTVAAVMNLGIYPQGYYPQFSITAIVVPGTQIGDVADNSARFLDNRRIEGTIDDMVMEAMQFCQRNMKIRTIIDRTTGTRQDKTEYPPNAIREAVLNALIHRDYSFHSEGTPVQIIFFNDRLEIRSPGNLYGRMTVEQLGHAKPDLRNPLLAIMAEALTGAENRYSGIPTMRREMNEYGLPEPIFENRRNEFIVILYNKAAAIQPQPDDQTSSDIIDDLLVFCQTPRTRAEIAEHLGIKTQFYVMSRYVQPLLESGRLAMTIPEKPRSKRQTYYTNTL